MKDRFDRLLRWPGRTVRRLLPRRIRRMAVIPVLILAVALGGTDSLANKWVYHRHCHDEKTAEDLARLKERKAAGVNTK